MAESQVSRSGFSPLYEKPLQDAFFAPRLRHKVSEARHAIARGGAFFGNGRLTVTKYADYVRYVTSEATLADFAEERDLDRTGIAWGAFRVQVSSKRVESRRLRMCDRRGSRRRVGAERGFSGGASRRRAVAAGTLAGAARRRASGRQAAPANQRANAETGTPTKLDKAAERARYRGADGSGRSATAR
jgi:hypothetical protein